MKVTLNLAQLPSMRERLAWAWALPVGLLGLVGLVVLGAIGVGNIREYRRVRRETVELTQRRKQLADQESRLRDTLDQPQYRAVLHEAQFVNGLIDQKEFSVTELVARVATLIPATVRLRAMTLTQEKEGPIVHLSIAGRDERAVEDFLTALEDAKDFSDVSIVNQGFESDVEQGEPVTVLCTARYIPGGSQ